MGHPQFQMQKENVLSQPGWMAAKLESQPVVELEGEGIPARFQRAWRTAGMMIKAEVAAHNADLRLILHPHPMLSHPVVQQRDDRMGHPQKLQEIPRALGRA